MTEQTRHRGTAWGYRLLAVILMALALQACQRGEDKTPPQTGKVLARVNGDAITREDVEVAAVGVLGAKRAAQLDPAAQKKILESLILSKVMSQAGEKELKPEEKDLMARQVNNYRETLLVKRYLRQHVQPLAITAAMIKARYEKYPQRYGARTVRDYLMLSSRGKVEGSERENTINALNRARTVKDWQAYVARQQRAGIKIKLSHGKSDEKLLQRPLREAMASLQVNGTSKPFLLEGKPYLVRISAETRIAAKPLKEVSARINQELLPEQLNKAIMQLSAQLRKSAKIEYMN